MSKSSQYHSAPDVFRTDSGGGVYLTAHDLTHGTARAGRASLSLNSDDAPELGISLNHEQLRGLAEWIGVVLARFDAKVDAHGQEWVRHDEHAWVRADGSSGVYLDHELEDAFGPTAYKHVRIAATSGSPSPDAEPEAEKPGENDFAVVVSGPNIGTVRFAHTVAEGDKPGDAKIESNNAGELLVTTHDSIAMFARGSWDSAVARRGAS